MASDRRYASGRPEAFVVSVDSVAPLRSDVSDPSDVSTPPAPPDVSVTSDVSAPPAPPDVSVPLRADIFTPMRGSPSAGVLIQRHMLADADVLFTAHRDGVFRYLCRIVGHGDARELTQEVFLRVARGPLPAADAAGLRAWIFRIARNLALNHVRDDRRRGIAVDLSEGASPAVQELTVALREALDRLAPLDRDVFLMREAGGLSYDEIAVACELTPDAVRSRLHRARQQLRSALGSLENRHPGSGVKL